MKGGPFQGGSTMRASSSAEQRVQGSRTKIGIADAHRTG
jgi:hypothetical protein